MTQAFFPGEVYNLVKGWGRQQMDHVSIMSCVIEGVGSGTRSKELPVLCRNQGSWPRGADICVGSQRFAGEKSGRAEKRAKPQRYGWAGASGIGERG